MIRKDLVDTPQGACTRVTFELPQGTWAETIHLVGDFNDWNQHSHPFHQARDGSWWISVDLSDGRAHRFHYLVDGECWLTDGQARPAPNDGARAGAFIVQPAPGISQHAAGARPERQARLERRRPAPVEHSAALSER